MDFDTFKSSLQQLKNQFKNSPGLSWGKHHLRPQTSPLEGELLGWTSNIVLEFTASKHFLRLKENWKIKNGLAYRDFFTYHYGPYEDQWDLLVVKCRTVIARVDAMSYYGRGFHIHDGAKDSRIYQDELTEPDLSKFQMPQFIDCVLALRQGKSLDQAFGLKRK